MGKPPLDIAEYIRQADYWKGKAKAAEAELAEIKKTHAFALKWRDAELAELRKDKARLDWAQDLMMERRELNLVPQTNDLGECSVTIEVFRPPVTTHSKRTVRAAIDAAMEGES